MRLSNEHGRSLTNSIRFRLAMLVLLAVVPMLVLVWYGASTERHRTLTFARDQMASIALFTAEQQNDIVQEAENLLRVLVRVPAVGGPSPSQCHELLQAVADDHPRIEVLTITDTAGQAICNSRDERPNYSVADRTYYRELMVADPPDMAVSELVWGRGANRPVIVVAVPLPGLTQAGLPAGLALASLSLDWFSRLTRPLPTAGEQSIIIVDGRDGSILATNSRSPAATAGGGLSAPALTAAIQAAPFGGIVDAPNPAGVESVFGFARVPGTRGHIIVAVGVAREMILQAADRQLHLEMALGLVAAIAAVAMAYGAAQVWLLRPTDAIIEAVRRFGHGMRPDRIATGQIAIRELRSLATTINVMVDEIEQRDLDLKSIHAALATSEQHHRALAENVSDMITRLAPDCTRVYVSPACKRLLGYEPEELIGRTPQAIVHPDDWPLLDATLNAPLRRGEEDSRACYRAVRKDGTALWLESRGSRLPDGSGFVVVTRDISERKHFEAALEEANARLEVHALQDALTGLANRRRFDQAMEAEWKRNLREGGCLGLLLIDVDCFKLYNDALGHPAGDECLRLIAAAVSGAVRRPGDLAARYGGEEFAVILPKTDLQGAAYVGELVAEAVRSLRIPHPMSAAAVVTVSIGAASDELDRENMLVADDLVQKADSALYDAKKCGRNIVRLASASASPANPALTLAP